MGDFFHGWRRKAGCVLLVMATVLTALWLRSRTICDEVRFCVGGHQNIIVSLDGCIVWCLWNEEWFPTFRWYASEFGGLEIATVWGTINQSLVDMRELVLLQWTVPYWALFPPMTLLSAYLLLWPGKRPEKKTPLE